MSRQVSRGSPGEYQQISRQVSRGSAGEYQADEQAGVAWLSWRVSGRGAGWCRAAELSSIRQMSRQVSRGQLASIRQMSRQVSRGSAVQYQADEQAGVAGLSWRVSGR